jgi:Xaa-Pro aminopeptidase
MAKKRVYFMFPWEWEDRKQYLNLPFPMSEYERRIDAVRRKMEEDKVDAVFLYGDVRQYGFTRWLTNFYPQLGQSMAVLTLEGDPILLTTASAHGEPMHSYIPETWVRDVRCGLFHNLPNEDHPTLLSLCKDVISEKKLTGSTIGVVGLPLLTYDLFLGLKESFPEVDWLDWGSPYERLRAVKSDLELEVMQRGAEGVDRGFEAALKAAKPGVTELEVAGVLECEMRKGGVETVNNLFDTRVCSGPRSALKNGNPTDRKLQRGDSLFIDISAQYHGYCLDVSTSHVVDAEPSKEQLLLFETSAQMTEAMIASSTPGTPASDLVEVTRAVAEENGLGQWFIEYIVGHGIGAAQLEIPRFNPGSEDILAENMTFSLEPMVVDPVLGTGTIERLCAVGPDGGRLLSKLTLRPWTKKW